MGGGDSWPVAGGSDSGESSQLILRKAHLNDLDGTERDIQTENWRSRRIVLAREGVGFSFHDTVLYAGTESSFWYANHIEAVYCVGGEGELVNDETGEVH